MPMPQLESLAHESRWKTLQYMGDILEKRRLLRLGHAHNPSTPTCGASRFHLEFHIPPLRSPPPVEEARTAAGQPPPSQVQDLFFIEIPVPCDANVLATPRQADTAT